MVIIKNLISSEGWQIDSCCCRRDANNLIWEHGDVWHNLFSMSIMFAVAQVDLFHECASIVVMNRLLAGWSIILRKGCQILQLALEVSYFKWAFCDSQISWLQQYVMTSFSQTRIRFLFAILFSASFQKHQLSLWLGRRYEIQFLAEMLRFCI